MNLGQRKGGKKINVSYKTSLSTLKDILNMHDNIPLNIMIKIPTILQRPIFHRNHTRLQVYEIGCQVFRQLGVGNESLTVKKYANCVVIINKNICLLVHFEGRIYFGGWEMQYFDEGSRHGLGLEYFPNKEIYYG